MGIQTLFQRARPRFSVLWLGIVALASGLADAPAFGQASVQGKWSPPPAGLPDGVEEEPDPGNYGWPIGPTDAAQLSTGEVLVWFQEVQRTPKLWNPSDGLFTDVEIDPEIKTSIHCAGHAFLADGSLVLAGGGSPISPTDLTTTSSSPPIPDSGRRRT